MMLGFKKNSKKANLNSLKNAENINAKKSKFNSKKNKYKTNDSSLIEDNCNNSSLIISNNKKQLSCKEKCLIGTNGERPIVCLKENEKFKIVNLAFDKQDLLKVLSMGVSLDEYGKVLRYSPLKNVCLFEIRGSCVAVSRELAQNIIVLKEESL